MLVILRDLKFLVVEMLLRSKSTQILVQPGEMPLYLDSFKIDKGIDGYGGGLIVCFVCISTELCPKDSVSIRTPVEQFNS
jgi:hypothetical protein